MHMKSSAIELSAGETSSKPASLRTNIDHFPESRERKAADIGGAFACLDNSSSGATVLRHARAVADGLDIPLRVINVLPGSRMDIGPDDPIQWQIKNREAQDHLRKILEQEHETLDERDQFLLNGMASDELPRWTFDHVGSLMAVTSRDGAAQNGARQSRYGKNLGNNAQKLLENSAASLLLIPPDVLDRPVVRYQRLLVPLDGSCRAESILPFAVRLARAHEAELVLAIVVPKPEIVEANPYDPEARDLKAQMLHYSKQNAHAYVDQLQARLGKEAIAIRTIVESDGDPRDRLLEISSDLGIDLIVMSARGRSGMNNRCCGNVARYIAVHSEIPLLMVRQQTTSLADQIGLPDQPCGPRLFWESAD